MFFSEKLQPRKSKWAELTAISLGYSRFSTWGGGGGVMKIKRRDVNNNARKDK